ncbi:unnamed protein product [Caenorhabditis angaria]|uniref:Uncharacterized protein n=1 Tax=Caenorhabditis angaria TaxID=860376 RepID=A0A9P1I9L2_9PELO|nr:unnamed protein product [Caenorhabditis angaria]
MSSTSTQNDIISFENHQKILDEIHEKYANILKQKERELMIMAMNFDQRLAEHQQLYTENRMLEEKFEKTISARNSSTSSFSSRSNSPF